MFCPSCGANNTTEQKFCRSCGLNLQQTAMSLLEQLPSAQKANLLKYERMIEKFGNFALGGLGIVGLIGITVGLCVLVTKVLVTGSGLLSAILMIAFVFFAILSLIFVVFNEGLKEKKAKSKPILETELAGTDNTVKLIEEKHFQPVPSVTESTTKLLHVEKKTSDTE